LLKECNRKQAKRFSEYLETHRKRIVNYDHYQTEQICSIGSGIVESAGKQVGQQLKLPGAQWKPEKSVSAIASLRCAYLNEWLCCKDLKSYNNSTESSLVYAATLKVWWMKEICPMTSPFLPNPGGSGRSAGTI